MKQLSKKCIFHKKKYNGFDIQSIIMVTLTTLTIFTTVVMGLLLYNRYMIAQEETAVSNAQSMVSAAVDRINEEIRSAKSICSAANYNIIREYEALDPELGQQFTLLYETNSDKLQSMALFNSAGQLIISEPVSIQKENTVVAAQDWFTEARTDIENMHFSTAHIQNILVDETYKYNWVISVSSSVDINQGKYPVAGVLLVNLKYSIFSEIMDNLNEDSGDTYYYLCTSDGELIYHPRRVEITRGLFNDDYQAPVAMEDGTYEITMAGQAKKVVVSSVSYTGWKLVAVVPEAGSSTGVMDFRYYIITTVALLLMLLLIVNRIISHRISGPILKLNESVKSYEAGGLPDIYIGGSAEIRHLGYSVKKSYEQIEKLMDEIVVEQSERRKSELAALQSQINPHFLYNTLESITWMVETGKNTEAVDMISELARLLRISLSKGKTIIKIADELQHSRSYMSIQKVRYKERFQVVFDIDPVIEDYCTVKLIIQPLLENAIYYGVGNMDSEDGGCIVVRGYMADGDIYICVEDNGQGMPQEVAENILTDNTKVPKHGSGVGVINVHNRIQLLFGKEFGLIVESEPDVGSRIIIHLPAIIFNQKNQESLEQQHYKKEKDNEQEK